MATRQPDPLFCDNIGNTNTTNALNCCYPDNQDDPTCRANFNDSSVNIFNTSCHTGDCLSECNTATIYSSHVQNDLYDGTGKAPIRRYLTCANVPNMAGYLRQGVLEPSIQSEVEQYISKNATNEQLQSVTYAVTECLTATCRHARLPKTCQTQCSAVNLLTNSTTPNVEGLNLCLNKLCTGQYNSLPFADADVVGIGVSSPLSLSTQHTRMSIDDLTGLCIVHHAMYLRRHTLVWPQ